MKNIWCQVLYEEMESITSLNIFSVQSNDYIKTLLFESFINEYHYDEWVSNNLVTEVLLSSHLNTILLGADYDKFRPDLWYLSIENSFPNRFQIH